jgi:hypothetical protein
MSTRLVVARVLALLASAALVVSAFLPWTSGGRVALDLRPLEGVPASLGLALIAVAALPAMGVVFARRGLPPLLGALATGTGVLVWLAAGTGATLAPGVLTATVVTVVWLHASALSGR